MLRDLRIPFFTIVFLLLGIFLYTKLAGPLPFSVTSVVTTKENMFTVQGTGEATAVPDTAMLTLGVNKEAAAVQDAQNQVNQVINKITNDLKTLGIEEKDIKTVNYSVNPNYDYGPERQTQNGYTVNATIEARVSPIEKANQAIDLATKAGATQVGNVQFVLDDEKQNEIENQARREAINQAKEKAQSIAKDAGISLGRLVDVQESGSFPEPIYRANMALEKATDSIEPPTELSPGENTVTITVTLSYETF